jgi:hypothetical protein
MQPQSLLSRLEWYQRLEDSPDLGEEAASLYKDDLARLRSLESKLVSHFQFVTALVPLSSGLVGVALARDAAVATALGVIGVLYLAMAALGSRSGIKSLQLSIVSPSDLQWAIDHDKDPAQFVAAARLEAVQRNGRLGVRLNNDLWAAGESLILAAAFLSGSVMAVVFNIA